jgi:hypothetical protein
LQILRLHGILEGAVLANRQKFNSHIVKLSGLKIEAPDALLPSQRGYDQVDG